VTEIKLFKRGSVFSGLTVEGHSGYAEAGKDILCAAVSAAVQLTECQLNDVLGLTLDTETDEKQAYIMLTIAEPDIPAAQAALTAFALTARQWAEQYPDYISFQEV
jgi:hypothetical protein